MGSAQHARILFAQPNQMMRLSGAFGPLQGEAVAGTLTIRIKKTGAGSAIRFDYVVGGYMRFKVSEIAPAVDRVLGAQLVGLAKALGGTLTDDDTAAAYEPAKRDSNLEDEMAELITDDSAAGGDDPKSTRL